jgi:3,4-dihydroxy 2-butanone 4-phosphate synthase
MSSLEAAITAFESGDPILIHDAEDREGETDLVISAAAVEPKDVAQLRNDAGGLICVAVTAAVAEAFQLPFLQESLHHPATSNDPDYDSRSSFSLPVNHRETYTGITDVDRALTITRLAEAAEEPDELDFSREFRVPGHVPLLRGDSRLIDGRRGHTELSLVLATATDSAPATVVCEMLDDETGEALSPEDAKEYASQHGLVFVDGAAIIDEFAAEVTTDGAP